MLLRLIHLVEVSVVAALLPGRVVVRGHGRQRRCHRTIRVKVSGVGRNGRGLGRRGYTRVEEVAAVRVPVVEGGGRGQPHRRMIEEVSVLVIVVPAGTLIGK